MRWQASTSVTGAPPAGTAAVPSASQAGRGAAHVNDVVEPRDGRPAPTKRRTLEQAAKGSPLLVRWHHRNPGHGRPKPWPAHPNRCFLLKRPVLVVCEVIGGLERDRVLYDDLPPLRVCCGGHPGVVVAWWDAVFHRTRKLDPRDRELLFRALSLHVRLPTPEDSETWRLIRQWERGATPREVRDPTTVKRALDLAMARARATCRPGEDAWAAAEQVWASFVGCWWPLHDPAGLAALSEKAFRLADEAIALQRASPFGSPERAAEWSKTVARWHAEAKELAERLRSGPGAARTGAYGPRQAPRPDSRATGPANKTLLDAAARVLGISWPCTADEVKRAYRAAVLEHHPDRGGDEARMKEINAAYDVLMQAPAG